MSKIKRFKISKDNKKNLTNLLISEYGVPEMFIDYAIYFKNQDILYPEIYLNINPVEINYRFIGGKSIVNSINKKLSLNSEDVFAFIKTLPNIGYSNYNSGQAFVLKWATEKVEIQQYENSLIGDFISINMNDLSFMPIQIQNELNNLEVFTKENLEFKNLELQNQKKVLSDSGLLNTQLIEVLHNNSIPIKTKAVSLKSLVDSKSNDYSLVEKYVFSYLNLNLVEDKWSSKLDILIKDKITIIIPSYNSENTVLKVLHSIESQNLTLDEKKLIEVIIIDDGSKSRLSEKINKSLFTFHTSISTSESNLGLAKTRNIGMSHISGFLAIFIDSDIILPLNYIKEHYLRHLLLPNSLLMSFKENVSDDKFTTEDIENGIEPSQRPNDSRLYKNLVSSSAGIYFNQNDQETNLLEETNYFKNFGYGRVIGNYDLPTMVIGHNFSIRTEMLKLVGDFNTNFEGWGLEDSYFGAQCISKNMWIIPVLSSNVYHLDHLPRSGSEEQKKIEFEKNLKIYNLMINKPLT